LDKINQKYLIQAIYLIIRIFYYQFVKINYKQNETILENKTIKEPVTISDCENCRIVNCDFSSNQSGEDMLHLSDCRGCTVAKCKLHGKSTVGVALKIDGPKTKDNIVEDCEWTNLTYSEGNGGEPVRLGNSSISHLFLNNIVRNCRFKGLSADVETISIKSCGNIIEHCIQENCKSSFVIRHGHTNTIQDNEFIGEGGLTVYGKDNKILGNHFKDNMSKQFPPLTLINGNTKDEPNEGASGSGGVHASYTQVRNCEITGNTFENCNKCVVWGRDPRTFKPQGVKFRNNKVIADKVESLVIEFSGGAEPEGNEFVDNEVIGVKARIDIRIAKAFTGKYQQVTPQPKAQREEEPEDQPPPTPGSVIEPQIEIVTENELLHEASSHVITDSWTLRDALGYRLFSHAIARFLTHTKTVPPLCMSIQAPWGQGKTSLMRMVQQELDLNGVTQHPNESRTVQLQRKISQYKVKVKQIVNQEKNLKQPNLNLEEVAKEFEESLEFKSLKVKSKEDEEEEEKVKPRLTVWFNAWAYENTEQVWSGLADSIVQQIAERLDSEESMKFLLGLHIRRHGTDKIVQRINERVSVKWWQNIKPTLKKFIPIIGISSVITTIGWIDKNQFWPVAGITGLVGSLIVGGLQIFQEHSKAESSVREESAQQSLGEYVDVPDYNKGAVVISNVVEDIQTILKRIPKQYRPLIIFVDDLDRCSPTKVTNIIEAINLFLGGGYFSDCIFVLGMDAQMVAAALEESYSKVISRLPQDPLYRATGWKFMDKFVQLPFIIPPPEASQLNSYVDTLLLEDKLEESKDEQLKQAAKEMMKEPLRDDDKKKLVANKHGLKTEQEHKLLDYQIKEREKINRLDKKIDNFSDEDPYIRKLILQAAPEFLGNPREVKRFMNVFRFHYFMLSARQTEGLSIPSLEHVSRWIVLTLKWPTISRWLQGNTSRLLQIEGIARASNDRDGWKSRIETEANLKADAIPEIFDEAVFLFFKREVSGENKKSLSYSAGKGLY
jgi:hypothetical protein